MNPVLFYKCLADETRLRSIMLIQHEGELCVCELTASLAESQPKISRHLAQLRQCGLLIDRREGKWVFYRINPDLPEWCVQALRDTAKGNPAFLAANLEALNEMGDRPTRASTCC
ncbi:metalloregulator ArsR/SmtB family transcription factor [Pontibacterium granulatum]|uniref:metalloregulator ArsR/SmtB family transcription factor n=1 Tax=Pontibacterium granulatum TaxID=2036029 RepID=UPI00249AB939|nr:metalloregulator ArsR/SmtB family transcription factor [Pontibacterium granulatum]MDI3325485.1 metalloregulator ArsR/SmtB family transcription factor [Pontibacterium granulatum]